MIHTLYNVLYRMQRISLDHFQGLFKQRHNKVPVYVVTIIDAYLQYIIGIGLGRANILVRGPHYDFISVSQANFLSK